MSNETDVFESYVRHCYIEPKSDDGAIFCIDENSAMAKLDGYAVIPMESYTALREEVERLKCAIKAAKETSK